ncbi:MAG: thioredoxin-dependent thiol peroxidase [Lentisphaeria bacterium]|nr:thioredoxin-dependent thiol peroxidase [Lentisphaeria bacterium]
MLLKVGTQAPEFSGIDQDGENISLSSFKGKKVILYFYPKDNTPGCTKEACSLRDNFEVITEKNAVIVGVSGCSQKAHKNFVTKYELPFHLLVDQEKEVIEAYGAWGEKKNYGKTYMGIIRSTFIINEEGVIENVIEKVKTATHGEQVLEHL